MNAIDSVSKKYGFKKIKNSYGISFILDCYFWETKHKDIYITDYDVNNDTDLKERDTSMLFYSYKTKVKTQEISNEILKDEVLFNSCFNEFIKEIGDSVSTYCNIKPQSL